MKRTNIVLLSLITAVSISCSGGGGSSGSSGGGGGVVAKPTVSLGNITTIPVGQGASGKSSITFTNSLNHPVILKDLSYVLSHDGVTDAAKAATASDSLLNGSQCGTVAANSGCSITISALSGSAQGQATVRIEVTDSLSAEKYVTSTIVSYSNSIPAINGVRYTTVNNNLYNQIGGSTTLTVPLQLTQDFKKLTTKIKNSNPNVSASLSCDGNSYKAKTSCNLYVRAAPRSTLPTILADVLVGEADSLQTTKAKKGLQKSLQGETGYIFDVPVVISQNNTGNMLTSAINVLVSPSNGVESQVVTLLNNGTATISGIVVNGITPVDVFLNGCSNPLAAGDSCTFKVRVNSTTAGQSGVIVNYNNGAASGNPTGVVAFNVVYIPAINTPGLTLSAIPSDFDNTAVNSVESVTVIVKNTGSAPMTNLKFSNVSSPFTLNTTGCPSGSTPLAPGNSCTMGLQYSPTAVQTAADLRINASADWDDQEGNKQSFSASTLLISYSAISGSADISIVPNYVSFAIRADNNDTVGQSFTIVNSGLQDATINDLTIGANVTAFARSVSDPGTCVDGQNLAANANCTINTVYGPTNSLMSSVESQIYVNYVPSGGEPAVKSYSNLVFNSSNAALIQVDDIVISNTTSGIGTESDPYIYVNAPGAAFTAAITYINNGTAAATDFNVALNKLPVGFAVDSGNTDCPVGISTGTLAESATCTVTIYAVDPAGLYNPYALSGTGLGFNIPGFSYQDTATGLNTHTAPVWIDHADRGNTIYVTTGLFASIQAESDARWTTADSGGVNPFTFTGTESIIITIPTSGQFGSVFLFPTGNSCTITDGSCMIRIRNQPNMPLGTYSFNYYVSPAGTSSPDATNSIIQNTNFVYVAEGESYSASYAWMGGSNTGGSSGTYGARGASSTSFIPSARDSATTWSDTNGKLWIFGGFGLDNSSSYGNLNDLWKYNPANGVWTWVSGESIADQAGIYTTPGASGMPGGRYEALSWVGNDGNFYIFGGGAYDSTGDSGAANDLWQYNVTNQEWIWLKGESVVAQAGVYGTKYVPAVNNTPGGRSYGVSWKTPDGKFWLYGGEGYDGSGAPGQLGDLWQYSPQSNNWTWMSGATTRNEAANYGTQGVVASTNTPGARGDMVGWADNNGNLWLFGGYISIGSKRMNDLWEYKVAESAWVWIGGSQTANQPGIYINQGYPTESGVPGGRVAAMKWVDNSGKFWLFGGYGYDQNSNRNDLNDLWVYELPTVSYPVGRWTWVGGSPINGQFGIYGTLYVASPTNVIGAREYSNSNWVDSSGNLWLFGGLAYDSTDNYDDINDLWKIIISH